jgi:putative sigma-54 modulation protein
MNGIEVRGLNVEVTPALRECAEKRMAKVLEQFEQEGSGIVRLKVVKDQQIVEATLTIGTMTLRSEEQQPDMYTAIDSAGDKLERQIRKYKTKLSKRIRMRQLEIEAHRSSGPESTMVEEDFSLVRTKSILLTPMTTEEAILQMNLLHHDFFAFFDIEANGINVVYRRKDEKYGMLELER